MTSCSSSNYVPPPPSTEELVSKKITTLKEAIECDVRTIMKEIVTQTPELLVLDSETLPQWKGWAIRHFCNDKTDYLLGHEMYAEAIHLLKNMADPGDICFLVQQGIKYNWLFTNCIFCGKSHYDRKMTIMYRPCGHLCCLEPCFNFTRQKMCALCHQTITTAFPVEMVQIDYIPSTSLEKLLKIANTLID